MISDALILLKFEILPENEDGNKIENGTRLRYAMKYFGIPNKLLKTKMFLRSQPHSTSLPTVSKNSGRVVFLHNGYTKWKNDVDLESFNLINEIEFCKGCYGANYRYKEGFILQNNMYIVETNCLNQLLFDQYDLSIKKPYRFTLFVPYSTLKIQDAVTSSDGSFSLMLAYIPTVQKVRMTTSSNSIEKKGIELILFVFTENVEPQDDIKLQGFLRHEIFHPGVYFDDPNITHAGLYLGDPLIDNISKSTLLRIS